jgi:hypothetical protein
MMKLKQLLCYTLKIGIVLELIEIFNIYCTKNKNYSENKINIPEKIKYF